MITLDMAQLSNVTGGADLRSPMTGSADPTIGLRPGATTETRNPVRKIQPFVLGLRPGATE
jgi:hypothetical protein